MIKAIGLIISCYVILQCLEMHSRPASAFSSPRAKSFVMTCSILCIIATVLLGGDLLLALP